jgi:hypothetical protein
MACYAEGHESVVVSPALARVLQRQQDVLPQLISELFRIAPSGQLNEESLAFTVKSQRAQNRAQRLREALVYDLNGDLAIDHEEAQQLRAYVVGRDLQRFETMFAVADTDGDGVISVDELGLFGAHGLDEITVDQLDRYDLLQMDVNDDGVITVQDLVAMVAYLEADTTLADPTIVRTRETSSIPCELPTPSQEAEFIFLTTRGGSSLSSVTIAGLDKETEVMSIFIEEGEQPIFLVSSIDRTTIVVFWGATERVEHYVGAYRRDGIGIVGLDPAKTTLVPSAGCVPTYVSNGDSGGARMAAVRLEQKIGDEVDRLVAASSIGHVALPSGELRRTIQIPSADQRPRERPLAIQRVTENGIETVPVAPMDEAAQAVVPSLMRFSESGITFVPASLVEASSEVLEYDVMPREAGLLQLVTAGKLEATTSGRSGQAAYRIVAPIPRFPAGLSGSHSVMFFLAEGVPMPAGSPAHSPVFLEETGECLGNSVLCRDR